MRLNQRAGLFSTEESQKQLGQEGVALIDFLAFFAHFGRLRAPRDSFLIPVRAEIIAEVILERACPIIFKTFLLEVIAVRLIPVICPVRRAKPENRWKRWLAPDRAHPARISNFFRNLIPGNMFRIRRNFGPNNSGLAAGLAATLQGNLSGNWGPSTTHPTSPTPALGTPGATHTNSHAFFCESRCPM